MSQFHKKLSELKENIEHKSVNQHQKDDHCRRNCSPIELKLCKRQTQRQPQRQQLCIQQPIIIERKVAAKQDHHSHRETKKMSKTTALKKTMQTIQPFVPINIPVRQKKHIEIPDCKEKQQIQIHIEKDEKDNKQCLKKLLKKIHRLTDDLACCQKQRSKLQLELQHYKKIALGCKDHEKIINKLEGQKCKLQCQVDMLKKLLKQKDDLIDKLRKDQGKPPIIKEVIVQKLVEVPVEVIRHVPGPQRIVERVVQVPKHIEVPIDVPREVIKQIPVYVDKPIYIDRPYEVQRRVEVPIEIPYQVPVEVPVYVDRPVVQQQWLKRIQHLEIQIEALLKQNSYLHHQNNDYRRTIQQLDSNLSILRKHNQQKNKQLQVLLHNSVDYHPISPVIDHSLGSVPYSVSSYPHPHHYQVHEHHQPQYVQQEHRYQPAPIITHQRRYPSVVQHRYPTISKHDHHHPYQHQTYQQSQNMHIHQQQHGHNEPQERHQENYHEHRQ